MQEKRNGDLSEKLGNYSLMHGEGR